MLLKVVQALVQSSDDNRTPTGCWQQQASHTAAQSSTACRGSPTEVPPTHARDVTVHDMHLRAVDVMQTSDSWSCSAALGPL